ncbi:histidine phosphatase family protein [Aggregatibacter actinomycetemcomitans]|uniref:histidine phosphatase family protein n=1 Tax=Aggregatibacter actinomycetemcomitans TaxID=714 RepID=UPI0011DD5224|nr:histidine phosphatase family protein [Aggregatibacter actinomycetemcomitans]QEH45535.1 histidine phosphatase family protein [Aggregatibacter actinomycetemcomitans]QEH49538.1 histidine phosphatase family protein [Aggregatibacter actinomycetemcomitans]
MNKNLTFYLIRHGRTLWNEQGLLQGFGNSALTESGVKGAQLTGMALKDTPFVAAYTSCLQRTIDTAQHILGERNVPLFQHYGLNEQYFGTWEGLPVDELRHLEEFQQMRSDAANYKAQSNNGETFEQLAERAIKAIQDIIQVHDQGNILIISHGHTLRLLLSLFNGVTWQEHRNEDKSQTLLNTSINIVRYRQTNADDGKFTLEVINETGHLS